MPGPGSPSGSRIDRRDLLRLVGATAAASAIGALGCGGRGRAGKAAPVVPDVRAALRDAVARVREAWPAASGWVGVRDRVIAVGGTDARETARRVGATLVLRAEAERRIVERATGDVSVEGIAALAAALAADGPGGGRTLAPGTPVDHAVRMKRDPRRIGVASWLADVDATLRRQEALGSSRIVWRAAHVLVDDEETWFVGDGVDVRQRVVRVRSGLTLLAWRGARPMIGEVVRARAGGVDVALDDAEVGLAIERALEQLTPGEPAAGDAPVVLDGSVVAALVAAGIGEVLTTARWARPDVRARALLGQRIATSAVSIADDPLAGAYAGYRVDDEGHPAARTPLVEAGVLAGVLADQVGAARAGVRRTGHGRRGGDGAVVVGPSDLVVAPGAVAAPALVDTIEDGYRIEDADGAIVDPATWRVTIRARRARRVVGGKLTGHVWSDVEVRGDVPGILGAVTAIGDAAAVYASPAAHADRPATGVVAPALATRAELTPRRRA